MQDFYVVGRRINSGLSAEVFEATEKATGGRVALKVYFNSDRAAVHETITEHVCMTRAACDLVLRCHGIVFDGCRPALVLDLAQQSLRNYLQVRGHGTAWCCVISFSCPASCSPACVFASFPMASPVIEAQPDQQFCWVRGFMKQQSDGSWIDRRLGSKINLWTTQLKVWTIAASARFRRCPQNVTTRTWTIIVEHQRDLDVAGRGVVTVKEQAASIH